MNNVIVLKGVQYKVIKNDITKKIALLCQVSHLANCIMYGGQYSVVDGVKGKIKNYLTLDAANELYNEIDSHD